MIYCTKLIEKEKFVMSKNLFLRVAALLIVMCLLTVNAPITGFALETYNKVSIPVRTIEELYNIRDDLTAKYVLMNDIDLTSATAKGGDWDFEGRGWNPIGSNDIYAADKTFSGVFDGNGYSIIGMRIDTNESQPQGSKEINAGLFSSVSGEVKNLNLIDCSISAYGSNGTYVGILAAKNIGKISNCTVSGNSTGESPSYGGESYAGGMIGINIGIIQNCGSSVNVNVKGTNYSYAGGIAAYNYGIENSVAIQNCFNKGKVYLELTPVIPEQVQLISVKNGALISDLTQGKQYVWVADGDITANGLLMTFTFTTADDIEPGDYEIGFIVRGCVNYDEQNVAVTVVSGKISIVNFTYGDANGDGVINGQDVIRIKKYLADYDYETGTSSIEIGNGADANGDGVISGQDIVRLKKYLANYDYETGTSTIELGPQKQGGI